ncbi:MAG: molecular chaperone TorD family protein [Thaumarchaeota archaeon]|nr:molecular chaperone TorD family protein [Nitrososphaerota archaeon]
MKTLFLRPPSKDLLNYLRKIEDVRDSVATPEIAKGIDLLRKGANILPERLALEHTLLFIGPYRLPAPPYESVYRTAERLVMQQPTKEVRRAYRDAGLEVKGISTSPDDHVCAELEFMQHLCVKTASSLKKRKPHTAIKHLESQRKFLDEHLINWVPEFSDDILRNTKQDFYKGVALLLSGFVSSEREHIPEIIEAVRCEYYASPRRSVFTS